MTTKDGYNSPAPPAQEYSVMNYVYLSPHFPPNYYHFCLHLHGLGVNTLGLADESYDQMRPELKAALTQYYRVNDMHNYDELLRALGFFTHHYGKIDRLDSQNEYWLETEALLRTDFNIFGLKTADMGRIKRKSLMKDTFKKAGVRTARGRVVHTIAEAKRLINDTGYPVIAKPDIGVGAAKTYKIQNPQELESFFETKPVVDYIMEEFISGQILTFDGLTDREGNLVYCNSLQYSQGIMEAVNDDGLIYYFTLRDIPADLEDAGRRMLKAYDLRERFFHFEFFRTFDTQEIVGLEVNMRPPGGMTTDMWNYASDIDIYRNYAYVVAHNRFPDSDYTRKYHVGYIGRKFNRSYRYCHEDLIAQFKGQIVHAEPISGVFSAALGDFGYLVRSPDSQEIHDVARAIHEVV
jgi:hypothetical protein